MKEWELMTADFCSKKDVVFVGLLAENLFFSFQLSFVYSPLAAACKHLFQNKYKNFGADSRWTQYKPKTRQLRDHRDAPMRYQQTDVSMTFPTHGRSYFGQMSASQHI